MKKYHIIFLLTWLLCMGATVATRAQALGTYYNPRLVSTPEELWYIINRMDMGDEDYPLTTCIKLTNDLDFSKFDYYWISIKDYAGVFDGNYHTIKGLRNDEAQKEDKRIGLIGSTKSGGEICNLTMEDCKFYGSSRVGTFCGENWGTITNCYNKSDIIGDGYFVDIGGVCGTNYGTIDECGNEATIAVNDVYGVGGICGVCYGTVKRCYNHPSSSSPSIIGGRAVGGICGHLTGGLLKGCYNTAVILGDNRVGGLVGDADGDITRCFNRGQVSLRRESSGEDRFYRGQICAWSTYDNERFSNKISYCYGFDQVDCPLVSENIEIFPDHWGVYGKDDYLYGLVCWLLRQDGGDEDIWFQYIDNDSFPVLRHVFEDNNIPFPTKYKCDGKTPYEFWSVNMESDIEEVTVDPHAKHVNGVCPVCHGDYEAAPFNSEDDVYELSNVGHLYWFANLVNTGAGSKAKARLMNDISVNENVMKTIAQWRLPDWEWTSIGNTADKPFSGEFDGNGHTISGLFAYHRQDSVGLFGYAKDAVIKNVRLTDTYFDDDTNMGGICSYAVNTTIHNCTNEAMLVGASYLGGICGQAFTSEITSCVNKGEVRGSSHWMGGICGQTTDCTIASCANHGDVGGFDGVAVGGICGYFRLKLAERETLMENCYSTGKLTGHQVVGGLCGFGGDGESMINQQATATIKNCYSVSPIVGTVYDLPDVPIEEPDPNQPGYEPEIPPTEERPERLGALFGQLAINDSYLFVNNYRILTVKNCCYEGENYLDSKGGSYELPFIGALSTNSLMLVLSDFKHFTAEEFAKGDATWFLNGGQSEEVNWYQNLREEGDVIPQLVADPNNIVYQRHYCDEVNFMTNDGDFVDGSHNYSKQGICILCKANQPADINAEDHYLEIHNLGQLKSFRQAVADDPTVNARLLADIVLNENVLKADGTLNDEKAETFANWTPMCSGSGKSYQGTFDGQGHAIRGVYSKISQGSGFVSSGLFGYLSGATIKNLGVTDAYFSFSYTCGGIAGSVLNKSTISNCYVQGYMEGGQLMGLICGGNEKSSIIRCAARGTVKVFSNAWFGGGICGQNKSSIKNCYFYGTTNDYAIADNGGNSVGPTITNCYYNSTLHTGNAVNGLPQYNHVYGLTTEEFRSGKAAWLLNGAKSEGVAFFQSLDEETGDAYPVFTSTGSNTVYAANYQCDGTTANAWTNDGNVIPTKDDHLFDSKQQATTAAEDGLYHFLCEECDAQVETAGVIKGLNSSDDCIELSREAEGNWVAEADLTLKDAVGTNWYKAPIDFTVRSVTYSRAMTNRWGTLCLPFAITAADYAGQCDFYTLSGWEPEANTLTLNKMTGIIPAGTPLVICRDEQVATVTLTAYDAEMKKEAVAGSSAEGYQLKGIYEAVAATSEGGALTDNDYIISNNKFWNIGELRKQTGFLGVTCAPFRSYITYNIEDAKAAPMLYIGVETPTGTELMEMLNDEAASYYDTNGRRNASLTKGVNIIQRGGKLTKVIVK